MAFRLETVKILQVHKVECCLMNGFLGGKETRLNIPKTEALGGKNVGNIHQIPNQGIHSDYLTGSTVNNMFARSHT